MNEAVKNDIDDMFQNMLPVAHDNMAAAVLVLAAVVLQQTEKLDDTVWRGFNR